MSERDEAEERRLVDQLRVYQLRKLDEHRWKGHWGGDDLELMMILLRSEIAELDYELDASGWPGVPGAAERIAREAADVANFCAMIADIALAREKS